MTASMLALTSAAAVFVALLLAVAWLLWRGRDVPVCSCCRSCDCWRWPS